MHGLVPRRIEGLPGGSIAVMPNFSNALASSCSVASCPAARLAGIGPVGVLHRQLQAVASPAAARCGELLERVAVGGLDVALRRACARCRARPPRAGTAPSGSWRAPRTRPAPAAGAPAPPAARPSPAAPSWVRRRSRAGSRSLAVISITSVMASKTAAPDGRARPSARAAVPRGWGSAPRIQGGAEQFRRHIDDRDDPLVGHARRADDAEHARPRHRPSA